MVSTMKVGDLVIVNDVDAPQANLVALVTSHNRAMYISENLKSYELMTLGGNANRVRDFGNNVTFDDKNFTINQCDISDAKYSDGQPREWQQHRPFTCELSMKATRKIATLIKQGKLIE